METGAWEVIKSIGPWAGWAVVLVYAVSKLVPVVQESIGKQKKISMEAEKAEDDAELRRNEDSRVSLKFLQERLELHVVAIEKNQESLRKEIARLEKGRAEMMADLLMERAKSVALQSECASLNTKNASVQAECASLHEEVRTLKLQVADLSDRLNSKESS